MIPVNEHVGGIRFSVQVHPRAKKNAITGEVGEALKISLTAPPVDGKGNEACVRFLAKLLRVPKASVSITAGLTSRKKVVRVVGLSAKDLRERLNL